MANDVTKFNLAQVPDYIQKGEVSALAKSLMGAAFGKRISIKGSVFRLIDSGKEIAQIDERYLDVVIVAAAPKVGRTYYAAKWKADTSGPPNCWSAGGDVPDATIKQPQAKTCATCPQNVKGSGEGDSRACRYSQRVAVTLANDLEGSIMQLSIPAKSLFGKPEGDNLGMQAYARYLSAQHVSPNQVITRLKFDTSVESPKLFFKAMRYLTAEEYEIIKQQGETTDALQAITMTVSQVDEQTAPEEEEEAPAPAPKAAKGNGTKQAAPVTPADDDEDEAPPPAPKPRGRPPKAAAAVVEEEAPTKRKSAEKPELPKRESLKNVVADWGADD